MIRNPTDSQRVALLNTARYRGATSELLNESAEGDLKHFVRSMNGWLRPQQLYGKKVLYRLTSDACRLLGLLKNERSFVRPLRGRRLCEVFGILQGCLDSGVSLMTTPEIKRFFPLLDLGGRKCNYFLETGNDRARLGHIVVYTGQRLRRFVRKLQGELHKRTDQSTATVNSDNRQFRIASEKEYRRLLTLDWFVLQVVVPNDALGKEVVTECNHLVSCEVRYWVVPDLEHLIPYTKTS